MKSHKIIIFLMYAGCIPFIFCSFLLILGLKSIPYLGDTINILQVYTLVIASFMAGNHWGQYLSRKDDSLIYLPIFSNLIAVFTWITYIFISVQWFLISFILVLILLLLIDYKMAQKKFLSKIYFRARVIVTAIVSIALSISILNIN